MTQTTRMGDRIARRRTVQDEHGQNIFVGPPFRIVATHVDRIIWHHDTTGETQLWLMNGERIARRATVQDENGQNSFIGPPFRIVGAADFNPEGLSGPNFGIVWYNDMTGETQIWFMWDDEIERIHLRATVQDENGQPIFVGPPFRIVAVGA